MEGHEKPANHRVSINDVAKLAGVSVGTVSHALNSVGYVKQETREKIIRAAETLNYVPNRAGRILKTRKTDLIMLAIPDTSNEIYFGMIEGVQKTIKEYGYSLLLYYTNGLLDQELGAVRLLQENVIDGLILVHFSYDKRLIDEIIKAGNPVVLLGMCNHLWANRGYPFGTVSIDVYQGILAVMQHLLRIGHKKIGYLAGKADTEVYGQRHQAYMEALKSAGLEYRQEYVSWNDYTEMGGYNSGRALYRLEDKPTAICCSNDLQAIGCWEAVRDIGGCIPDDLALTGLDNINISRILNITSLDMREMEMGISAANQMMAHLVHDEKEYEDVYFKPNLIVRDSSLYMKR